MSRRSLLLAPALGLAGAGLVGVTGAQAQSGETVGNTVEEVVVTGSYIGGGVQTNALPVDVWTAENLRRRSSPSVVDLLKTLPFARLSLNYDPFTASAAGRVVKFASPNATDETPDPMTEPAPPRPSLAYGTPNTAYVRTWRERPDPRPMWALNMMRYRPKAQYPDGRATDLTGWEADDLYAPHEELAAVGAAGVLRAAVVHQLVGDGDRWDRIAIANYPTPGAMLDMQMLPAFQERHAHKLAGMEFTIVLATFRPEGAPPPPPGADEAPMLLLQVIGDRDAPDFTAGLDALHIATFDVDNTIIGDERRYAQARWHAVSLATADELRRRARVENPANYVFLLSPERNTLAGSLQP